MAKTVSKRKMKRTHILVKKRSRPVALIKTEEVCGDDVAGLPDKENQLQKAKFFYVDSKGVVHVPSEKRGSQISLMQ